PVHREIQRIAISEPHRRRTVQIAKKNSVEITAVLIAKKNLFPISGKTCPVFPIHSRKIPRLREFRSGDHQDVALIYSHPQGLPVGEHVLHIEIGGAGEQQAPASSQSGGEKRPRHSSFCRRVPNLIALRRPRQALRRAVAAAELFPLLALAIHHLHRSLIVSKYGMVDERNHFSVARKSRMAYPARGFVQ